MTRRSSRSSLARRSTPLKCWRSNRGAAISPFAGFPSPARDLIDVKPYRDAWLATHGTFSLNLIASRGCPFRCNWCAKPIFGDSFHARPAEEVAEEMRHLKEHYAAEHLWFADDIFALNRRWTQEFASEVEEKELPR